MSVSWATSSPAELRAHHAHDAEERAGPLPEDVSESAVEEAGAFRGGLLFTPPDPAPGVAIVYFHGGGFVAGSPATHRGVTAWLAKLTGMRVLSGRYRLAPEHPFPAQRDDAVAALAAIGGDRLILAGDSAGACVALWGLRGLDPENRARVAGLALLYGGFGGIEGGSIARHGTAENGLDAETLSVMYRRLGPPAPDIWPLAFAGEVAAPAYVLAAELDAVFDDSASLFQRLGSRADSRFVVAAGQDHGFLKAAGRDPAALRELQLLAHWVKNRAGAAGQLPS
ncbi:alpha/beta hydrolase [Mycobacterium sp. KBS0706]|uniref:alpha/beta hydrolase n=1 Tax=Mycobacterium sp. KBS0706 TaxID=2578109 RepID=UPI00110FAF25|nr:alpha/beta hydrolase fold domain-containing protein [Mycobacterium sp. KBS0706]TSD89379.1 alpha/beta hydrolase [Mycobacterium sp. KBS0706]